MTRIAATLVAAAALLACAGTGAARQSRGAEIHHDLGVEALRAGRAQEALQEFDQALKMNERFPEASLGRGLVMEFAFGRMDEAEKAYRRALLLRPDYPEAHNNLGQLLAKTGRPQEALAEFDLAIADMMYREPYVARCNKGQALYRMGRRDEGLAELRSCVSLSPRYCTGRRELGRILLGEGRVKESLEHLTAYAETCKQADSQLQLGLARMKGGDLPGAREAFEKCRELGAGQPEADECGRSLALLR
jgi:type IV pilus assembly protein PilF